MRRARESAQLATGMITSDTKGYSHSHRKALGNINDRSTERAAKIGILKANQ